MNFREPIAWLIIIALSFFILWQCEGSKRKDLQKAEGDRLHEQQIKELDLQAFAKEARLNELEAERVRVRDSAKVSQNALKSEIKGNRKMIAELRKGVQPKLDSFPDLREFVALQDSTIEAQDSLITSLELSHAAEVVNLEKQLEEKGNQIMIERVKSDLWRDSAVQYEKERNKLTKGKRFRNVVIGVLTAGIVYVSLKE